jgi:hypothetical protein
MSALHEFFAAEDDRAAAGILTAAWPPPVFRDEGIPPDALAAARPSHGTRCGTGTGCTASGRSRPTRRAAWCRRR